MMRTVLLVLAVVGAAAALQTMTLSPKRHGWREVEEKGLTLLSFSWSNCGPSTDALQLTTFSLTPDPVKIPGNVTLQVGAKLTANETSPIKVELELEKKLVGAYVKIPCIDNIGSCTYDDACALLSKLVPLGPDGKCPAPLPSLGVPCRCPLNAFSVNVPPQSIAIPKLPPSVPSWLTKGDYKAKATIFDHTGAQMGCISVELSLDS